MHSLHPGNDPAHDYSPFRRLPEGSRVLLAFSGGVDSAVAAALCLEAGLRPLALNLRLLEEDAETEKASLEKVRTAADALGIELEILDLKKNFREKVMRVCWKEYAEGRTPNPCVLCNPVFKFGTLLESARERGCVGLVTGHYVRIVEEDPASSSLLGEGRGGGSASSGGCLLRRGIQREKDQSYFLYRLSEEQLSFSYTPLGNMTKDEVRLIAARLGLPNAKAKESQDACFAPRREEEEENGASLAESLRLLFKAEARKGNFVHARTGKILGTHRGIHAYTIGQRKGTGIALGKPAYIKKISPDDAVIEITENPEELFCRTLKLSSPHWLMPGYGAKTQFRAEVQIRYRAAPSPATVFSPSFQGNGDGYRVEFDSPQRAATPGQSAVFYSGDTVIGGGIILSAE